MLAGHTKCYSASDYDCVCIPLTALQYLYSHYNILLISHLHTSFPNNFHLCWSTSISWFYFYFFFFHCTLQSIVALICPCHVIFTSTILSSATHIWQPAFLAPQYLLSLLELSAPLRLFPLYMT